MASDIQKLASRIAKREGKKSQASIGNIREILKVICQLDAEARFGGDDILPLEVLEFRSNQLHERMEKKNKG